MHPRPTTSADPARELLDDFPEYATTQILDHLRSTEYARLDIGGQAYLDYTGGGMYADSQIREHAASLSGQVLGHPHSVSLRSSARASRSWRAGGSCWHSTITTR